MLSAKPGTFSGIAGSSLTGKIGRRPLGCWRRSGQFAGVVAGERWHTSRTDTALVPTAGSGAERDGLVTIPASMPLLALPMIPPTRRGISPMGRMYLRVSAS